MHLFVMHLEGERLHSNRSCFSDQFSAALLRGIIRNHIGINKHPVMRIEQEGEDVLARCIQQQAVDPENHLSISSLRRE